MLYAFFSTQSTIIHNSKAEGTLITDDKFKQILKIMSQVLDLSLLKGSLEESEAVSAALLETLKTRGVAKLKNHGLPEDLIATMFDYVS